VEVEELLKKWVDPKAKMASRFDDDCQNYLMHAVMRVAPDVQGSGVYDITGLLEMLIKMMPRGSSVMSIAPVDITVRRNPLAQAIAALHYPEASDARDDFWRAHLVQRASPPPKQPSIDDLVAELGLVVAPGTVDARNQLDELILDVPEGFHIHLHTALLSADHDLLTPGDYTRSILCLERLMSFCAATEYGAGFLTTASFAFRDTIAGSYCRLRLTDALNNSIAVFNSLLGTITCLESEPVKPSKRARESSLGPRVKRSKTIAEKLGDGNALKQAYTRMQAAHDTIAENVPPRDLSTAHWLSVDWAALIERTKSIRSSLQEACDILDDIDWYSESYPSPIGSPSDSPAGPC
jgi:hypothetical protein